MTARGVGPERVVFACACAGFALTGCATPTVVDVRQVGDANLTCEQLVAQIEEADRFEDEARGERRVTGTNVAAAVFFPVGLVGTYMNTEEAMEAAQQRRAYLTELYEERGC